MKKNSTLFPFLMMAFIFSSPFLNAQLNVNNTDNAVAAVEALLGENVEIFNVTFAGNNDQVGTFECVSCNLGLGEGMTMSSGSVSTAQGPNNNGSTSTGYSFGASDVDLAILSGGTMNDASVLQFDFIPTGDSLVFNFVWGSEEYPEYSNSGFNDAFGFFLSGPGIDGVYSNDAINIALIPGTTIPITINNLNNGSTGTNGPCEFCAYYIHNGNGSQAPYNTSNYYIQPDGFTTPIQAYSQVQCGETYHIKLAIADAGDQSWNSFVFIEAGSFESNILELNFEAPKLAPTDSSVFEGCSFGNLSFTRPESQSDMQVTFQILVGGTAENGTDYSYVGDSLVFEAGVSTVNLPIQAYSDAVIEETESIFITILSGVACISSDTAAWTLYIEEIPPIQAITEDVEINCGDSTWLQPEITGGIGLYSVQWSTGVIADGIYVEPLDEITYFYTVYDTCNVTPFFGTVTVSLPDYPTLIAEAGPDLEISCLNDLYALAQATGGYGDYDYQWTYNGTVVSLEEIIEMGTVPQEGVVMLTVSDDCGEEAFDSFNVSFPDETINIDIGDDLEVSCLSQVTITAEVSGGIGGYIYEWTVDGVLEDDDPTLVLGSVAVNTDVELTIVDECGNVETASIEIEVLPTNLNVDLDQGISINCLQDVTLIPEIFGGLSPFSYQWSVAGEVEGTSGIFTWDTDEDVIISLMVTDACGYTDSDFINVNVVNVPVSLSVTPSQSICPGDNVELNATAGGGAGSLSYQWTPGGTNNSSVNVSPGETTTYNVTVTDECGSANNASSTVSVYVADEPFWAIDDFELCIGVPSIAVVGGGILPYTFNYDLDALDYIEGYGFYGIVVGETTVTVHDLCDNEVSLVIDVSGCATTLPNIVTPNGDGENDQFVVDGLEGYPNSNLKIFNRWGELLYESANYQNQWDGDENVSGVYYWTFNRSDQQSFSGFVHIVRD